MLHRDRVKINAFNAASVDRDYGIAFRINAFTIRMNTADSTEVMLDHMLVKRVGARGALR